MLVSPQDFDRVGQDQLAVDWPALLDSPGPQVLLDRPKEIDGAAALARALAVLEALELAVGVGHLDENGALPDGVPAQAKRLLRAQAGVGHEPHEDAGHPVAAQLEIVREALELTSPYSTASRKTRWSITSVLTTECEPTPADSSSPRNVATQRASISRSGIPPSRGSACASYRQRYAASVERLSSTIAWSIHHCSKKAPSVWLETTEMVPGAMRRAASPPR